MQHKNIHTWLLALSIISSTTAHAFSGVTIHSGAYHEFDGPAHHGIALETAGLTDPSLTSYDIEIKEDNGNPYYPSYESYNTDAFPHDGVTVNIPYRSGNAVLKSNTTYCVRMRGVYAETLTSWAEQCGIAISVPSSTGADADGDTLTDADEYAHGTDPNNSDSDGDGILDNIEIAAGADPNQGMSAHLLVVTPSIDFGNGDAFGNFTNQHSFIEVQNTGDDTAIISDVVMTDVSATGASESFKIGTFPESITNIPPYSSVRVPVSFLPKQSGKLGVSVQIVSENTENEIGAITMEGVGTDIPKCTLSTASIDFGVVKSGSNLIQREVTISNESGFAQKNNTGLSESSFGFSIQSSANEFAPALRAFQLKDGQSINVPIVFQHNQSGTYQGVVEVTSTVCNTLSITVTGVVK